MSGPHHTQYNSSNGGPVYASQGIQNIYLSEVIDHFEKGSRALKGKLYPNAVAEFEEAVTTAARAGLENDPAAQAKIAQAHFFAALALLGGRNPGDRGPEEIQRIERHLEQVMNYADESSVCQAKVLWAIVNEDYYAAYGMHPVKEEAADFGQSLENLSPGDLEPFVTHLTRVTGATWNSLCDRAVAYGMMPPPVVQTEVRRVVDPHRPVAVKKYFTHTPRHRSSAGYIAAFAGAGVLIVAGLAMQNFGTLLFVVGGGWLAKWGFEELGRYREYLRRFREAEPKPSDRQLDEWLREDIAVISRRAGERVRLNAELTAQGGDLVYPIQVVVGIPSGNQAVSHRLRVRPGADGMVRANTYDVLIMFLTNNLISIYRCILDNHTGEAVYEENTEYHYRDIVGVSSQSIPIPEVLADLLAEIDENYKNVPLAQTFRLSITSGESLSVATGFRRPEDGLTGDIAWGNNARSLDVIKKMIRARHTA
ncbi:hypothetical protein KIPE111705_25740 [Kibdelosporangium persicum]|uniref:Uncharacterized protein n=1 Tax=Kibdelosporangium persicum TaxID=2698649 RepID=A0ABX2FIN6_9PSEU|nr:hypothetical protein [Kibdelosporangium persicum]NRN70588.1 hypothetical protein [Kibdelosporangium persicum]